MTPGRVSRANGDASTASTRLRARLALYAAAATLLFLLERALPNPVPWVRLGLANGVTLLVLLRHGPGAAAAVLALRLGLGGFFAGTLLGPQFLLAASGGIASWAAMVLAARWRALSALGVSVTGASAHAATQLAVVDVVFAAGHGMWDLLSLFLGLALATGTLTGLLVDVLSSRLDLAENR